MVGLNPYTLRFLHTHWGSPTTMIDPIASDDHRRVWVYHPKTMLLQKQGKHIKVIAGTENMCYPTLS